MEEEESELRRALSLSLRLLALLSYQGGVGCHTAMARSQGHLPLKQTGLPGWLLLACAFFVPCRILQKNAGTQRHDFAPKSYKRACRLVKYVLALLSWNCCRVLYWVGSAVLASSKTPMGVAGLPLSTECVQSFCACCCGVLMEQKPGKLLPEILLPSSRLPVVSQK